MKNTKNMLFELKEKNQSCSHDDESKASFLNDSSSEEKGLKTQKSNVKQLMAIAKSNTLLRK